MRNTPSDFGTLRLTSIATSAWLAAPLLLVAAAVLPTTTHAQSELQDAVLNVADVDSGKVQPLNLKPGCWQVRTQTNTDINLSNLPTPAEAPPPKVPTVDEAMKDWLDHLSPDMRARLTQAQINQTREIMKATLEHPIKGPSAAELQKQQADFITKTLAKGGNLTGVVCTTTPFLPQGKELYGTGTNGCTRSIHASGQELLGHVACPGRVTDYKRIDSEHFYGTTVSTGTSHIGTTDVPFTTTATTTSKWIAEASPHLPYVPAMTDLDGRRPRAPFEVATFDPWRIVAIIDGKKFVAQQAYFLLNNSSNGAAENWGPNLVNVMQQIYMRIEIYFEAARMQERQRHPGKYPPGAYVPLPDGAIDLYELPNCCFIPSGAVIDRETLEHYSSAFMEHQDATANEGTIDWGWDFYFSQAKTPEEKQALLRKVQEKYKVTVVDPDFFFGTRRD